MASPVNKRLERSVEHHDAARRMPWHLADGERSAPKLDARIRADVEGAFGMQILVGHHVAKGVRADFQILDGTYRRFRIHPYDTVTTERG